MSRRNAAPKRKILPDPLLDSLLISKFVNCVMKDGKKAVAEKLVYHALLGVAKEECGVENYDLSKLSPDLKIAAIKSLEKALENVSPVVEVRSRRVGGSTYQVPVEVRPERRIALGMRWIIHAAKARPGKSMVARLTAEVKDATVSKGGAWKKYEDVCRMAKANQAFAHFSWFKKHG